MFIKSFCFNIYPNYTDDFERILQILIDKTKEHERPTKFEYKKESNSFFIYEIWKNEKSFLLHQKTSHYLHFKKARELYVKSKKAIRYN
ncbi:antibiotic biosynthesis monooxygenase [Francisella sp. SYW-9]|uniref:putative quinol monooxygenase n=1 Tax=Francisella sp. SYW-9 TaxID=2610888 RepID=UPI001CD0581C